MKPTPADCKAVVVGNGPSAGRRPAGALIDSLPLTIRLNSFVTRGYEWCVGSKTNYWACTPRGWVPEVGYDRLFGFLMPPAEYAGWQRRWSGLCRERFGDGYVEVPMEETLALARRHGWPEPLRHWPSTGAVAFAYFLERLAPLAFWGFDFLKNASHDVTPHYYPGTGCGRKHAHVPAKEEALFRRAVRDGLAVDLGEFL